MTAQCAAQWTGLDMSPHTTAQLTTDEINNLFRLLSICTAEKTLHTSGASCPCTTLSPLERAAFYGNVHAKTLDNYRRAAQQNSNTIPLGKTTQGQRLHVATEMRAFYEPVVVKIIEDLINMGVLVTIRKAQQAIWQRINVAFSRYDIRLLLHKNGFSYQRAQFGKKAAKDNFRLRLLKLQFLDDLDKLIAKYGRDKLLMVYLDESYIHDGHKASHGYQRPGLRSRGVEKGTRFNIIHAGTKQ